MHSVNALPSREAVLKRRRERMAKMERAGHVGRGDDNRECLLLVDVRQLGVMLRIDEQRFVGNNGNKPQCTRDERTPVVTRT